MPVLSLRRDGSAVVVEHGEPDRVLDPADPLAILEHVRSLPEFEEGLTAAGLMRCLAPWAGALSRLGWIDFADWGRALAGPPRRLLADAADPTCADGEPPLAAVAVVPTLTATTYRKGRRTLDLGWDTVGVYAWPRVDPRTGHRDIHCSLSFAAPADWAHLPIRLERRAWISERDLRGGTRRILAADVASTDLAPSDVEVVPTFLDAVVLGFLDDISFHGTPEETAGVGERLAGIVEAIRDGEADGEPGADEGRGPGGGRGSARGPRPTRH